MAEVLRSHNGPAGVSLFSPSCPAAGCFGGGGEEGPVLALLLAGVRRGVLGCGREVGGRMKIGWPTNVRHVAHVTFDRFHGFLGLPVEFEPEVPRRAPSASATVFGVSTESMQCSYDSRGNSIPTILLLMQRRLYEQSGLCAEGIFRINPENSQEELVRDQLNNGILPEGIDVHCLAGLIKAWFRELPKGILDSLPPELVMECQSEEECRDLVKLLPPTEAALLDWAINLMADVVQEEQRNKMNARNVAMVFAPNMTQMADPLTALMYAVQVMNFLKMLILRALKERQEHLYKDIQTPASDSSDKNGSRNPHFALEVEDVQECFVPDKHGPIFDSPIDFLEANLMPDDGAYVCQMHDENPYDTQPCQDRHDPEPSSGRSKATRQNPPRRKTGQSSNAKRNKGARKGNGSSSVGTETILSRINSRVARLETWR